MSLISKELWLKFRIKDGRRNIPILKLGQELGGEKCSALLKAYILTWYDVTSKIGTKASAVASKPENYLDDFGIGSLRDSSLAWAEKYLVRIFSPKSNCKTSDDLRYEIYKTKKKALNQLPPTSSTIRGHLLRAITLCTYAQTFWTAAVKFSSLQTMDGSLKMGC